jgi:hypothetical protein
MEKRFLIKCRCGWSELNTGLTEDLTHLKEIKKCKNCGGRSFQCPKCKNKARLIRIKGNQE